MMSVGTLRTVLKEGQHDFLQYQPTFHTAALSSAKRYLDPIIGDAPAAKRKRYNVLDAVYVDGFDVDQVWEQVNSLVNSLADQIDVTVPETSAKIIKREGKRKSRELFDENVEIVRSEEDEEHSEMHELGEDEGMMEQELVGLDDEDEEDDNIEAGLEDEEALSDGEEDDGETGRENRTFRKDAHGLNDGFFSIDDFNRETEQFELADANGVPLRDNDEESIDFNADPDLMDDPEGGEGEDDYDDADEEEGDNSNEVMYKDFFALSAQARKKTSSKPRRGTGGDDELSRITSDMERVRRDLFDEEVSNAEEDEAANAVIGGAKSKGSSHAQRQATLVEQIRQLEAANIEKRDWTLSGEARANQRPMNSLLEEDLDFERTGKPVPVITQDVTNTIEDMIKRRILAEDFDEVVRRRPDDIKSSFRRGRFELDDSKSQKSLAEVYEEEHLHALDPGGYPEVKDAKLQAQHKEIELLFNDVTRKLDSLSSWHYTPKPAKPSLAIVADTRTIDMEEATATAAAGGMALSSTSQLAPQEVYRPGTDQKAHLKATGEVLSRTGEVMAAREMTSDDKKRRRRREKERKKKSDNNVEVGKAKDGSRKSVVDSLRRSGVTVIGKHGERKDVDGNVVKVKKNISGTLFML